ncbi:sulfotransferase family protein [Paracoccus sp. NSM]|uniref:sulfotransferase family protein n=1 Tax=Paracoccus sp. NSM TaxID=3457784 RepID=UPI004036EE34
MVEIVIAGVQKCGTTSMHRYLAAHPQIIAGRSKELHFFDDPAIDWERPDYSAYTAQFPGHHPGLLRLDASPSYVYLPHCLERLRRWNPQVRLILVFRDPLERAWSHWAMRRRRGVESLDFDAAIRAEPGRIAAAAPGDISYKAHAYVDRGRYGSQLARALDVFAAEQILCLTSEALRADPASVLEQVSAHLGIAPFAPPERLALNSGPGLPMVMAPETRERICATLRPDIQHFSKLSGIETCQWSVFGQPAADHRSPA